MFASRGVALRSIPIALVATGVTGFAAAHPAPFSFLDVYIDAEGVSGALVVHDYDAAHELGLSRPELLLDAAVAEQYRGRLTRLMDSRLRIDADARWAVLRWDGIEVILEQQSLRLRFQLDGGAPGRVDVKTLLFPNDPNHQTFVNVYDGGQLEQQAILDASHRTLTFYRGSAQGHWAVVQSFAQAGIHHIFIGLDHVLFLLGLLLLGGSLLRLAGIVTAFTVGHSMTLSLATLGIVHVNPQIVEPAIALSVVVVGVDTLLVRTRSRPLADARDLRPWLAGAFGLIHGFGFASVLSELGLPRHALGWSLAAFNIGVEIGQLVIVALIAALLALLSRYSRTLTRRCALFGSIGVMATGMYWFIERTWFWTGGS
jgi:hydrogenase/urease accessory protein HupE